MLHTREPKGNKDTATRHKRTKQSQEGSTKEQVLPLFSNIAQQEELGRFLVGLANEICVNVTSGFHEVGKSFSTQLANLSTVISAQRVSQIVCTFEGESSNFRDWI